MEQNIEYFRKEYKKQKILENIVNSRVLIRPKTKKWQVLICYVILPFLIFGLSLIVGRLKLSTILKIFIIFLGIIIIFETYFRVCLICTIKCYQHYASDETRRKCKCIPSCSEYAILCIKKIFPLFLALKKIKKRLFVTCDGEDYIVDFPNKKMGKDFENIF